MIQTIIKNNIMLKNSDYEILQILNLYYIFVTNENMTKNDSLKPAWLYEITYYNIKPCLMQGFFLFTFNCLSDI